MICLNLRIFPQLICLALLLAFFNFFFIHRQYLDVDILSLCYQIFEQIRTSKFILFARKMKFYFPLKQLMALHYSWFRKYFHIFIIGIFSLISVCGEFINLGLHLSGIHQLYQTAISSFYLPLNIFPETVLSRGYLCTRFKVMDKENDCRSSFKQIRLE